MSECLFCKIISKAIPAHIVYEDDAAIAFLDINPVNPGHTLVVPKRHFEKFTDMPEGSCMPVSNLIMKVMQSLEKELGYEGVNLIQNNGSVAGQLVPHVHFHIIPRKVGDGHAHWHGQAYQRGEDAIIAARLREALNNL